MRIGERLQELTRIFLEGKYWKLLLFAEALPILLLFLSSQLLLEDLRTSHIKLDHQLGLQKKPLPFEEKIIHASEYVSKYDLRQYNATNEFILLPTRLQYGQ